MDLVLQVACAHGLDARLAIGILGETFLDRFVKIPINPCKVSSQGHVAGLFVVLDEQAVGHVQAKECEGVKTSSIQLGRQNGIVGQGMTVDLTRRGCRHLPGHT